MGLLRPARRAAAEAWRHLPSMHRRDIIVVGASAGGVPLLLDLAAAIPAGLPAAVFIVLHTAPDQRSLLPDLLNTRGPLPASHPLHGDAIEPGRIYVAPPDNHLLVKDGFVEVVRGPKENGHRPAVDALFRSASRAYGPRVIGVVLSGYLDCGTAGMLSVKARGGLGVVQDPATALAPDMPESVLSHVAVDHVVSPAELPGLLVRLAAQPADAPAGRPAVAKADMELLEGEQGGERAELVCPECQGVLTHVEVAGIHRFRCHVGHAFSLGGLVEGQRDEQERALWAAVRSLEESAALCRRLARSDKGAELRRRFAEKEALHQRQAAVIKELLLQGEESDSLFSQPREAG